MRLIMVVSANGLVSLGPEDDMSWTTSLDRKLFRALTGVGGVIGVGRTTLASMPMALPGRSLVELSRSGDHGTLTLNEFYGMYPTAWLGGGMTIAVEAARSRMLREVHLCRLNHAIAPERINWEEAQAFDNELLVGLGLTMRTDFGELTLEAWR